MISDTNIKTTLTELDVLYNAQPLQAQYFSKLALLELCGWLELTMDCIVKDCAGAKLTEESNKTFVENKVVGKTHGFHYDDHFRPMLMRLVGLIQLEQIELPLITSGDLSMLESQLGSLNSARGRAAHTHINGTTLTYEAPSRITQYLSALYPILQRFEAAL